jgi:hypothetical protein
MRNIAGGSDNKAMCSQLHNNRYIPLDLPLELVQVAWPTLTNLGNRLAASSMTIYSMDSVVPASQSSHALRCYPYWILVGVIENRD